MPSAQTGSAPDVVRSAGVSEREIAAVDARERAELDRRARRYRGERPRTPVEGRTVIVVDDGIATGSTARAACQVARAHGARRVVQAAPVAPGGWVCRIGADADEFVALATPEPFWAIGQSYRDSSQTTDEEVVGCLERAARRVAVGASTTEGVDDPVGDEDVDVPAGAVHLAGHLALPLGSSGIVIFAHGTGSSRHSPRNRHVAEVLNAAGFGTLLFDLLTTDEERDRGDVFDVPLLAARLIGATRWLRARPGMAHLPIGYFGASTGAAAALWAAAEPGSNVMAVVSRGGRPDLAGPRLAAVEAPTLLIVGGHDGVVLDLNRRARAELRCESRLTVVPGAAHLFEEPGTLDRVAELARDWFTAHLADGTRRTGRP